MRFNSYPGMIALRFMLNGRMQTLLIIMGIALGVAVQVFLISLIDGLQKSIIQRTVGSSPHITVAPPISAPRILTAEPGELVDFRKPLKAEENEILSWQQYYKYLQKDKSITSAAPVVNGSGYVERGRSSFPVLVKGITEPEADKIYKFTGNITSGNLQVGGNNVVIGQTTAEKTGLIPGDKLYLRNQQGSGDYFIVHGIYDLGSSAANNMVVMSLDRARSFLNITGISAIELQVNNVFQAENLSRQLRADMSLVRVESWQEKNKELLNALKSQSSSSAMIQFFVILSITLGISSVLAITAIQKSRQLGILKAMGVDNRRAALIFVIQGVSLGLAGSLMGVLLGLGLSGLFIYGTKAAGGPVFELELTLSNLLLPSLLAVASATLASLVPARRAAGLNPMEVIRNG